MTTYDLRALLPDLQRLEGAKVNKVYQPVDDEVTLNLWLPGSGRQDLHVGVGAYAVLTEYRRDNPRKPPSFAMQLRKQLGGGDVTEVRQIGFDRLLAVEVDTHEGHRTLIFELFGEGNVVLCEPTGIVGALRFQEFSSRSIRPGVEYKPPPLRGDPFLLEAEDVADGLAASDRDLVRTLAVDLDLGSMADEVVHRSGLDKDLPAAEADPDTVFDAIAEVLAPFRERDFAPRIYRDEEGTAVDVAPIALQHVEAQGLQVEPCDTVREAFDRYFSHELQKHRRSQAEEVRQEKLEKLDTRIHHQSEGIERLQDDAERQRATAEAIYQHYQLIEDVLDALGDLRGVALEDAVASGEVPHAEAIADVRVDERVVVLTLEDLEGRGIEADIKLSGSVEENASWHYDLASKAEAKAERAKEALEESRQEKRRIEEQGVQVDELAERGTERRFWFEEYRWCLASTGHVMVGGRDAKQNDRVVKRYLEPKDRYAHAEIHGAPSVVVKADDGDPPPEEALEQAIALSVAYSKAWKAHQASGEGYWVLPEQVSKSPESGEYLATGAFIIRGTRHHASVPVRVAVGRVTIEDAPKVMGGPVEAVQARSDAYVVLEPGEEPINEIAGRLADALDADVEAVQKALPPGPSRIVETHGVEVPP